MTPLRKLQNQKHRLKTRLWIIQKADEGRYPYCLYYKNIRNRRLKEIEAKDELRKVQEQVNLIKAV